MDDLESVIQQLKQELGEDKITTTSDPKIRRPNLELLRDLIEWEPSINLNDGLDKTIQYFLKAT